MKNWLLILVFIPSLALSQNKPIVVKLTDYSADKIPAACGYQNVWGILKFELIEPVENLKVGEAIFALFQCPRETIGLKIGLDNLSNGKSYFLTFGEKVRRSEIPANTTEIFKQIGQNQKPLFWMTDIKAEKQTIANNI